MPRKSAQKTIHQCLSKICFIIIFWPSSTFFWIESTNSCNLLTHGTWTNLPPCVLRVLPATNSRLQNIAPTTVTNLTVPSGIHFCCLRTKRLNVDHLKQQMETLEHWCLLIRAPLDSFCNRAWKNKLHHYGQNSATASNQIQFLCPFLSRQFENLQTSSIWEFGNMIHLWWHFPLPVGTSPCGLDFPWWVSGFNISPRKHPVSATAKQGTCVNPSIEPHHLAAVSLFNQIQSWNFDKLKLYNQLNQLTF